MTHISKPCPLPYPHSFKTIGGRVEDVPLPPHPPPDSITRLATDLEDYLPSEQSLPRPLISSLWDAPLVTLAPCEQCVTPPSNTRPYICPNALLPARHHHLVRITKLFSPAAYNVTTKFWRWCIMRRANSVERGGGEDPAGGAT